MTKSSSQSSSTLFIGITLFSMFFGAGNLIFAPFLGVQAGTDAWWALAGFVCTAVIMPIAAVVIISRYEDARHMISTIHPVLASLFMALVYLLIGPCVAIPRTASTSFEMFAWLLGDGMPIRIVYTVLFFSAAAFTAYRPGRLKDILGRIMGPILVAMVLILCIGALIKSHGLPVAGPTDLYASHPMMTGFLDGYQTMDILASFCFGIVILLNIRQMGVTEPVKQISLLSKAAIIAGLLLGSLYALLAITGMRYSADFGSYTNGALILSALANDVYGRFGTILVSLIFLAACYNVCSGLLSCCAEFFFALTKKMDYNKWLLLFTVAGILVSVGGLDFILAFSAPILEWVCPLAIAFLVWGWLRPFWHKSSI